jgi:undecaprenyl-diphosphatase
MISSKTVLSNLSAADHALMRIVNHWRAPRWVRWWMMASSKCGDGWFWAFCGVAVLASHDPERYAAFFAAAIAAASGVLVFTVLKKAVGRPRPCALEPHCWARLLPPDQFSFPSGHSITAFAVAVPLSFYFPSMAPVLLALAVSIALSRIILGMHFLTDVIAGSLIGSLLGYAAVACLPALIIHRA